MVCDQEGSSELSEGWRAFEEPLLLAALAVTTLTHIGVLYKDEIWEMHRKWQGVSCSLFVAKATDGSFFPVKKDYSSKVSLVQELVETCIGNMAPEGTVAAVGEPMLVGGWVGGSSWSCHCPLWGCIWCETSQVCQSVEGLYCQVSWGWWRCCRGGCVFWRCCCLSCACESFCANCESGCTKRVCSVQGMQKLCRVKVILRVVLPQLQKYRSRSVMQKSLLCHLSVQVIRPQLCQSESIMLPQLLNLLVFRVFRDHAQIMQPQLYLPPQLLKLLVIRVFRGHTNVVQPQLYHLPWVLIWQSVQSLPSSMCTTRKHHLCQSARVFHAKLRLKLLRGSSCMVVLRLCWSM